MKRFRFLQEPLEPAPMKAEVGELFERTSLVDSRIVGELSSLDQGEYDRVLQSDEHRSDSGQRERILVRCEIQRRHFFRGEGRQPWCLLRKSE